MNKSILDRIIIIVAAATSLLVSARGNFFEWLVVVFTEGLSEALNNPKVTEYSTNNVLANTLLLVGVPFLLNHRYKVKINQFLILVVALNIWMILIDLSCPTNNGRLFDGGDCIFK